MRSRGAHRDRRGGSLASPLIAVALTLATAASAEPGGEVADSSGCPAEELSVGFGIRLFSHDREEGVRRTRILDLLLVSGIDHEFRDGGYSKLKVLRAPLVTLFGAVRDGADRSVRVLDIPLVTLFRSDRTGNEEIDSAFLHVPLLGSLYRYRREGSNERVDLLFLVRLRNSGEPSASR